MRILYLHGFASGPASRKARFFRSRFEELGIEFLAPDLAEGDFENLTVTGQLERVLSLIGDRPARLIGSSLGGYVGAAAAEHLRAANPGIVERLVLLAPAFHFAARWPQLVGGEGMRRWLETGKLPVFHYGEGRMRDLGLAMYHDSAKWVRQPDFPQPAMIFHGVQDAIVPIQDSRAFASGKKNVRLVELETGHEMLDVLPAIWDGCREFVLA